MESHPFDKVNGVKIRKFNPINDLSHCNAAYFYVTLYCTEISKNMKKYFLLAILAIPVMMASCEKDTIVVDNPIEGKWSIISFVDNGTDKTSEFAPYIFTFDSNGNMLVSGGGGGMMEMCNWTKMDSVYHFNMMGMHGEPLDGLDDDWTMSGLTDSTCNFIDNNPNRDCMFTMHKI